MSERLPYEEHLQQQWHDLPLPDENKAWADMKRRLDDDDDDRVVVAWWRRGCGLWALLAVVFLAIGWWLLKPHQWFTNNSSKSIEKVTVINDTTGNNVNGNTTSVTINTSTNANQQPGDSIVLRGNTTSTTTTAHPGTAVPSDNETSKKTVSIETDKPTLTTQPESDISVTTGGKTTKRKTGTTPNNQSRPRTKPDNRPPALKNNTGKPVDGDKSALVSDNKPANPVEDNRDTATTLPDRKINDEPTVVSQQPVPGKQQQDSTRPQQPVTTAKKDSTDDKTADKKKKDKEKKPFFFSGGIALQQQVPIAGQTSSPYNAAGRKGSLRDYIPSVYLRFNKKDRWFFQGEFRYGAPQSNKPLVYETVSVLDTAGPIRNHIITTSNKVLKTYYHQLPFTFNHYLLPNWSLGGGVIWNKFHGAITQQDASRQNITTLVIDSVTSKIVRVSNDSNSVFSKSYFQAVIETQYQYKRFSLGARYAFGLQPYIRFTIPGLAPREEKNSSLQLFLRYQLWRSKER